MIGNSKENSPGRLTPEGLSRNQEILVDMLFNTRTLAPVPKLVRVDNGFIIQKVERLTSPIDFAQAEGEFAFKHHEKNPDAPLSPVYINLRNLPEDVLFQAGKVLAEIPLDERPDFCTGIPEAGSKLARFFALQKGIPYARIFDKEESEGGRKIVGLKDFKPRGRRIMVIDDTVTEGNTKLEAKEAAEEMGYDVLCVLIVVDRQQGAIEELRKASCVVKAAITLDQILRFGLRREYISEDLFNQAKAYLSANKI